jgi:ferredoxin
MINRAERRMKVRWDNRHCAGRARRGRFANRVRTRDLNRAPAQLSEPGLKDNLDSLRQRAQVVSRRLEEIRQKIEGQRAVAGGKAMAIVDEEECIGCGLCYDVCPAGAISIDGTAKIDAGKCTACLACVRQCPQGAIAVRYPDK